MFEALRYNRRKISDLLMALGGFERVAELAQVYKQCCVGKETLVDSRVFKFGYPVKDVERCFFSFFFCYFFKMCLRIEKIFSENFLGFVYFILHLLQHDGIFWGLFYFSLRL